GLPKFEVVGLGQSAVKEGRDRIMTAIKSSGYHVEAKRIIVNLAPASLRKDGSSLDLPIAMGILSGNGHLDAKLVKDIVVLGELSLDGSIQPIRGIFAMVEELRKKGVKQFIIPIDNTAECDLFTDIDIYPAVNLEQVMDCLQEKQTWPDRKSVNRVGNSVVEDWSDVKGQPIAKRAMEIAAAGGHHALLAGTPGVGKTLLAKRFPSILPDLSRDQELEVRKIQSLDDPVKNENVTLRPFRSPHHHASVAGIVGGGRYFRMGEFSLAHHGVLFMDEFPEFRKDVIESLREPLEEGVIRVSRAEGAFTCPAKFQLIAAMNLCPCGALGDEKKTCVCTPHAIQKYRNKLSGPIQDRLDLYVELKNTHWKILWESADRETSSVVRQRVKEARNRQAHRYGSENLNNANISQSQLLKQVRLDSKTQALLDGFVVKNGLSLRSIGKILRVSQTISDMECAEQVQYEHVCEALQYRTKVDRF
ncbi:MAG: YifB family Mg chelatase-like AAA ATPase, partial [Proteobacteria bacterium]|nr:YifB family Mg chelatase-like AAA ATPase [Pseudomonadota bacterium]